MSKGAVAKKLIRSSVGISDCTVVCGTSTNRAWPVSIKYRASRRQFVVEVPPELRTQISLHPFKPSTSGTRPNAMSSAICACAIGLTEITASTSSLSMPASRIAPMQTSESMSQRVRSGSRFVGTSAIPTMARLIYFYSSLKRRHAKQAAANNQFLHFRGAFGHC